LVDYCSVTVIIVIIILIIVTFICCCTQSYRGAGKAVSEAG